MTDYITFIAEFHADLSVKSVFNRVCFIIQYKLSHLKWLEQLRMQTVTQTALHSGVIITIYEVNIFQVNILKITFGLNCSAKKVIIISAFENFLGLLILE